MKKKILILLLIFYSNISIAQEFGRADSLRGYLFPERSCYDVTYYHLSLNVDPEEKYIKGFTEIHFDAVNDFIVLQIDLFENLQINRIEFEKQDLKFSREFNAVFVAFTRSIKQGENASIKVHYEGSPRVAVNAPWDGGFSWEKDDNGKDWIGVSCQGLGASSWWPNKDHQSDEPDSMLISCQAPSGLQCVANGNMRLHDLRKSTMHYNTYHWFVSNPINNYDVSLNIGDYTHFSDVYISGEDSLDLDYYVLSYNKEKAYDHFKEVKPMLKCYEQFFGPYPFWEDGYALVETPYLGMEHQSAIAYGNDYLPGYKGNTNFIAGLDFDYIIIHETGHEWWGNSITANDISDMWIQESFCTYSEVLYVECRYGYETMLKYVENQMKMVRNDKPIVGIPHVHHKGSSGDMYQKGSAVLHTIRNLIENDSLWYDLILSMTNFFKHQTIDGRDVLNYMNEKSGYDFDDLYQQYLYTNTLPQFQYKVERNKGENYLKYRWEANDNFDMPIKVTLENEEWNWIYPNKNWKEIKLELTDDDFQIATHLFLMDIKKL